MFEPFVYTKEFDSVVDAITIDVVVETPLIERECGKTGVISKSVMALIDTGAFASAISNDLAEELSLEPSSDVFRYGSASGTDKGYAYYVNVKIGGYEITDLNVLGAKMKNCQMIIGMNLLKNADYAVSNANGKTVFTIRFPPRDRIDFMK